MKQPSWAGSIEAQDAGPAPPITSLHDGAAPSSTPDPVEALLLLRAVEAPERHALAGRLLDEGLGSRSWRNHGVDLWELYDPSDPTDGEPVALAATRVGGSGRATLVAVVVTAGLRGRGIGQRMIEELADALRTRGVLVLMAAVPDGDATATAVLQRTGFRPSPGPRRSPTTGQPRMVWFDLEL